MKFNNCDLGARPRLVMKFGGTSMGDMERIRRAAEKAKAERDRGYDVAVVVSAMSGETNRLVSLANDACDAARGGCAAEHDAVAAAGEQVSAGLLALALQALGAPARSWLGWQVAVRTCDAHGSARILQIDTHRLDQEFAEGRIAVIGGFQGVSPEGRVATLGRGGSDTSAVAMAAALGADRCDIYTDVDGVYTTDPQVEPEARRIPAVAFDEMLELASQGAKVLQTRSVELGMLTKTPIQVLSSFNPEIGSDLPGAVVADHGGLERWAVTGVAFSREEARLKLSGLRDSSDALEMIFGALSAIQLSADLIDVRPFFADGAEASFVEVGFLVPGSRCDEACEALKPVLQLHPGCAMSVERSVAKISVVGAGLRSHPEAPQIFFRALAAAGATVFQAASAEIRLSAVIRGEEVDEATRHLHTAFRLEQPSATAPSANSTIAATPRNADTPPDAPGTSAPSAAISSSDKPSDRSRTAAA